MLDGSVARYFHSESEFGSRLDSLADFIFFALVSVKLVREIKISSIFMVWSGLIFAVRLICIGINCKKDKNEFAAHSFLDKLTGFLLFISVYKKCRFKYNADGSLFFSFAGCRI